MIPGMILQTDDPQSEVCLSAISSFVDQNTHWCHSSQWFDSPNPKSTPFPIIYWHYHQIGLLYWIKSKAAINLTLDLRCKPIAALYTKEMPVAYPSIWRCIYNLYRWHFAIDVDGFLIHIFFWVICNWLEYMNKEGKTRLALFLYKAICVSQLAFQWRLFV